MTDHSLPDVDELEAFEQAGYRKRQIRDAAGLERCKNKIIAAIRDSVENRNYRLEHDVYGDDDYASDKILQQLCDWINEQPGYRAKWYNRLGVFPHIVVKIPRKNQPRTRWPWLLRWIPGLGA